MEAKKLTRGRKRAEDPKMCIRLYIHTSVVNANGGEDELRGYLYTRASNRAKNAKK